MTTSLRPVLNPLVVDTGTPPIPEVQGWAARYGGALGPMVDMCQAAPGYAPHPALLARLAEEAGQWENARYGPIAGDPRLRDAYAAHLSATQGGEVAPDQVVITAGCNQAFTLAAMTLVRRGEAVVLPVPWYWNHAMTLGMLGIEARTLPCRPEDGFVPDPHRAERLLADGRVRAVVLVTPNNPTGAVYPAAVVARFHELCQRHGAWLILDETYRDFLPDGAERSHDLFADLRWPEGVVGLHSFSKGYCIPGHRLGAVAASAAVVAQFLQVLDCLHICPQRPAQAALAWAIPALAAWRAESRAEMARRAEAMRAALAGLPGWETASLGACFAYARHPFAGVPGERVLERMATERGVLALPGSAFGPGQDAYVRLAFAATDVDAVATAGRRLAGMG